MCYAMAHRHQGNSKRALLSADFLTPSALEAQFFATHCGRNKQFLVKFWIALILRRLPGDLVKKQDAKNEEVGGDSGAKPMIVKGMTDIFKKVVQQVQ